MLAQLRARDKLTFNERHSCQPFSITRKPLFDSWREERFGDKGILAKIIAHIAGTIWEKGHGLVSF